MIFYIFFFALLIYCIFLEIKYIKKDKLNRIDSIIFVLLVVASIISFVVIANTDDGFGHNNSNGIKGEWTNITTYEDGHN